MGIPVPSVVAYHTKELSMAAEHVAALTPDHVRALKDRFLETLCADLVEARRLYARQGYSEIPAYNSGPYAEHWFEKRVGAGLPR